MPLEGVGEEAREEAGGGVRRAKRRGTVFACAMGHAVWWCWCATLLVVVVPPPSSSTYRMFITLEVSKFPIPESSALHVAMWGRATEDQEPPE